MWKSGESRRRRHQLLAEMVAVATEAGVFRDPWRLVPRVWHHYRDEAELLRELHLQWRTTLAGEIYLAIESGDGDLQSDVAAAYCRVSHRYDGLRRILEAHADHPAIAALMRKEQALLAAASGPALPQAA